MTLELSSCTTVVTGAENGKYPDGNSVVVRGSLGTVLIDPSLGAYASDLGTIDRVLISHAHEDHMVGLARYQAAKVHAHHDDLLGVRSFDGFMEVYGMPADVQAAWAPQMVEEFHYSPRPDATGFTDGDQFDLGTRTVTCLHLAGHTRGHSGFYVEEDGVFFVGDIDLTSFGPYYGDHWSDLESFEQAIARVRDIDARWYVTFHHKGVVEGREAFVQLLDAFAAVIATRDSRMLEFLAEPRRLADMVEHRFVYRPGVVLAFADHVEARTATQHLRRFLRRGEVVEIEPGLYRAA